MHMLVLDAVATPSRHVRSMARLSRETQCNGAGLQLEPLPVADPHGVIASARYVNLPLAIAQPLSGVPH